MKRSCVILVLNFVFAVDGFKVLGVLPFGSKSHFAIGHSILKSLLNDGNEVTVISPYPQKKKVENYNDIDVSSMLEEFKRKQIPNPFELGNMHPFLIITFLYKVGADMVNVYMQHPEVKKFLKSGQKFDVCVIETFNADAFLGFADHVNCTLITYTTFGAVKWIDDMTSNQSPYSYVPQPFLSYTENMTFYQRLRNTFYSQFENFVFGLYHIPQQKKLYEKYFPNAKKSFDEIYKSSAIIFLNTHVSSTSARPYLPHMIEIGGIHVEPAKALPEDIQKFLDSASDGVVLFSMGSIIQAVQWPEEKREAFVKAFGKLKQKVLWKYENETLPNKPDNVMIGSWIPQRDILAHPNVKAFMTHGGLLGTTEALTEGVPVLGIPIFGDQKMNMAKAVARGYGLQIFYEDLSEENLSKAINELLSNPKYDENAKIISGRFNDRQSTPEESVVYWTKYALRHRGASHLQAAGNSLSFIQFHLIDVYLTFALLLVAFIFSTYKFSNIIIFKVSKSNQRKDKIK